MATCRSRAGLYPWCAGNGIDSVREASIGLSNCSHALKIVIVRTVVGKWREAFILSATCVTLLGCHLCEGFPPPFWNKPHCDEERDCMEI